MSTTTILVAFAALALQDAGQSGSDQPQQQDPAPPRSPQGAGADPRQAMWPSPTAEDWAKPVPITWQRTWEDAVAVSRETGKPIMIAVNMDGEIASEHYAGKRYRDPEVAKLFEPYVSVIASVYRHNPRDHDENGNRIPCPRFGCVTCGEHIAMEPIVYEKYLDETRVAPRHIMVELDGSESYDIFYAFDVKSVLVGIEEGITTRTSTELPDDSGDRPLEALVASRRHEHRMMVEQRFRQAKRQEKLHLLDVSAELGLQAPLELLRQAIFGLDLEVASRARKVLATQRSEAAIDLIARALEVPMPEEERELLIGALEAMAEQFARARSLAITLRGISAEARGPEVERIRAVLAASDGSKSARSRYEVEARIERAAERAARSVDPLVLAAAELARAEATLRLAVDPEAQVSAGRSIAERRRVTELRFEDAMSAAMEAERLGLSDWRTDAVIGLVAHYSGRATAAKERIARSFERMSADPSASASETALGWTGMGMLSLFAGERVRAIRAAARAKTDWPRSWAADASAAFDLLGQHPLGNDRHALDHHDFLVSMGARRRALEVLREGVQRFPSSEQLHGRLRQRVLWSRGVDALEETYGRMTAAPSADEVTFWHAGLAYIVAGEYRRRRGGPAAASSSYDRAISSFEEVAERAPDYRDAAAHYVSISIAGQARIAMEAGELEKAANLLIDAFEAWPDAAGVLDGLNVSAVTTTRFLLPQLSAAGKKDVEARLLAAMEKLPAKALELPEYETPPNTPAARNRDARGRQRPARNQGGRGGG